MASTLPYDQVPPRRPTIDDLGGGQKEDDSEFPPDAQRMITATDANLWQWLLAALVRVCPVAIIGVRHLDNDTFQINQVASPVALMTLSSVTVVIESGAAVVSWPPNVLPAPLVPPMAFANGQAQGLGVSRDGDTATVTFATGRGDFTLVLF